MIYTTEGIILKKYSVGEADAFFTIYTRDFGKIQALARGVKKENAKLRGHLERLNLSSIGFILGKNGERLINASLLNFWPNIRGDFEKIGRAEYITELIDRHCFKGEKDTNLWNLLILSFIELDAEKNPTEDFFIQFMRNFEVRLLEKLGYAGETDIRKLEEAVAKPF